MSAAGFVRYSGAAIAVALLAACGAGGSTSPSAPSSGVSGAVEYHDGLAFVGGRPVTAARPNIGGVTRFPSVPLAPDRRQARKYLEYIINDYGSYASVFDYPKSTEQIGTVGDVGGQGCTNVLYGYGSNVVWIVAAYNQISEYRIPKRLVKSLSISDGTMPSSCAMNTKGDMAVGLLSGKSAGDMVIFKKAKGAGTFVKTPLNEEFFDGYDAKGNLFFDGYGGNFVFQLAEIPSGSTTAVPISTSNFVTFPGSVQWDGKYVTVLDQISSTINRYTIAGTTAKLKSQVVLDGASDCAQTWIVPGAVFCADAGLDGGEVFSYPGGGKPIATFSGSFDLPLGTTAAAK